MQFGETDCGGSHDRSSSILDLGGFLEVLLDVSKSWSCVCVSTGILWLLLCPSDRGVGVFLEFGNDLFEWERTEVLNSDDGDIFLVLLGPIFLKIKVNLTGTKNDFSHLVWLKFRILVRDDVLESGAFDELIQVGGGALVSQQFLGCNDD